MEYLNAFLCGGTAVRRRTDPHRPDPADPRPDPDGLCGRRGCCCSAVGLYQPLVDWGGAGATVPLTGFGYCLAKGVAKAVAEKGLLGALTGGLTAAAGGIAAAVVFGVLAALIFPPRGQAVSGSPEGWHEKSPRQGAFCSACPKRALPFLDRRLAVCRAHNLFAESEQIPHLQTEKCFLRRTRRRKKRIAAYLPPAGGKRCEAFCCSSTLLFIRRWRRRRRLPAGSARP